MYRFGIAPILLLLTILLSACVALPDPEAEQVYRGEPVAVVQAGHAAGQTLVARRPRLAGIQLWLESPAGTDLAEQSILASLYSDPQSTQPLASTRLDLDTTDAAQGVTVSFPVQENQGGQDFYLMVQAVDGPVTILGRNEDAYGGGQAWLDGMPSDSDFAFRLLYDYDTESMLADLLSALPYAGLVVPFAVLLLLPGWLLLDVLGQRHRFDHGEQVALAIGLSLACVPLVLLWTTTLGLHWNRRAVLAGAIVLVLVAAFRLVRQRVHTAKQPGRGSWRVSQVPRRWSVFLWAVFGLSLAVRLAMIRDLAAPAWVDSVHHALVTSLIVDAGALPNSYAPFLNINTASYHSGFHSVLAAFLWLSDLDLPRAMLLLGQVLNAFSVFAAYLLTRDLTGDRVAGLAAAVVVGVFSPMPAYYASWGRYTQLAGLLILPAAWALARRVLFRGTPCPAGMRKEARPGKRYGISILTGLALAGLLLTHYQVTAFLACLLLASWATQRYRPGTHLRVLVAGGLRAGGLMLVVLLLAWPWLLPAWTTLWLPKLLAWTGANPELFPKFSWNVLTTGQGKYVLVLALMGLAWALHRRERFATMLVLWISLCFLLASLGALGLPGAGFVNYISVEIAMFYPLSVLVGFLVSQTLATWYGVVPDRLLTLYRAAIASLIVVLILFGAWTMLPILNPDTALYRRADDAAIHWIRSNVPENAIFLINPTPWYEHSCVGHDGGYWIAPLTGRRTMPPPALYGMGSAEAFWRMEEFCNAVYREALNPEALWPVLCEQGISHVYVGARGGILSPSSLADNDHYRQLFSRDGTWVFEVLAQAP